MKAGRRETPREGMVGDGGLSRDMLSLLIRESGRMWPVSSLVVVSRQDALLLQRLCDCLALSPLAELVVSLYAFKSRHKPCLQSVGDVYQSFHLQV